MPQQPNVILIMTDQQRGDAMGCAGNAIVQTPNLDALARSGVSFSNAYVQCPVCMASRAAIHTGRYPRAIGMRSMGILPPQETTIAETLKRAGYTTGMFGKLHFVPQSYTQRSLKLDTPLSVEHYLEAAGVDTPWSRLAAEDPAKRNYGFDETIGVEDMLWGHWLDWLETKSPEHVKHAVAENWGIGRKETGFGDSPPATRMFASTGAGCFDSHIPAELSASRFIVERSIEFIRRNAEKPFFVHCSFVDPHDPFNAPDPFSKMYDPADMETPPTEDASTYPSALRGTLSGTIERSHGFPDEVWRWIRANYFGMVSNIDDCVGRLMAALDELDLRKNTIIIFTSDHGEYLGGHRMLYKGSLMFDDVIRVPFIVNGPGTVGGGLPSGAAATSAGVEVSELVQEIDIYPTIMSLLGLPIHGGVQGHDLTPFLSRGSQPNAGPPWGDPPERGRPGAAGPVHAAAPAYDRIYCELDDLPAASLVASATVRTREWKLNYFPHSRTGMMFNLRDDPQERVNLYDDPGYSQRRQELTCELLDMYDVMKDPLPHRLSQA